jgi:hypothetical protein
MDVDCDMETESSENEEEEQQSTGSIHKGQTSGATTDGQQAHIGQAAAGPRGRKRETDLVKGEGPPTKRRRSNSQVPD